MPKPPKLNLPFWTKTLLVINGAVFVLMIIYDHASFFSPSNATILAFGAKDPIKIATGQWWRYITPIFVHIGIIHFVFNNYALKIIGPQIENILGPKFFIGLYLITGIAGNILSNATNLSPGAGASGALFGLIGAGLVLENMIKKGMPPQSEKRPGMGSYTSMALINIGLGFVIPAIDNAAHIGGLITGMLCMAALMNLKKNNIFQGKPIIGVYISIFTFTLLLGGIIGNSRESHLINRYEDAIADEDNPRSKIFLATQALTLTPENPSLHLSRAKSLIQIQEHKLAIYDLLSLIENPNPPIGFNDFLNGLENSSFAADQSLFQFLMENKTSPY